MDIKIFFAGLAFVAIVAAGVPYIRDTLMRKTKPHVYTWLVWTVTTGIATAGVWYGNGGYPAFTSGVGAAITFFVFLLSLKYGTRDIKVSDTVSLLFCLVALFLWIGLKSPLWSVVLGATIDIVAYWPTLRKTYVAPWSESLSSWALWILAPVCSMAALTSYNVLTLANYFPIFFVNVTFVGLFLLRRRVVPKPADILKQ